MTDTVKKPRTKKQTAQEQILELVKPLVENYQTILKTMAEREKAALEYQKLETEEQQLRVAYLKANPDAFKDVFDGRFNPFEGPVEG